MATHSSILVWKMPWTEEPGGLQSMGSQRVRHDLMTKQQHRAKNDKIVPLFLCRFILHILNLTRFKFKKEKEMAAHSSILAWKIPWTVCGVAKSPKRLSDFTFTKFKNGD